MGFVNQFRCLEVLAVFAVLLCLLDRRLITDFVNVPAFHLEENLPVDAACLVERSNVLRRSLPEVASPRLIVHVHRLCGTDCNLRNRASSPMRFAVHEVFDHPLLQSSNEFLSTITIHPRWPSKLQKPWRGPQFASGFGSPSVLRA